MAASATLTTLEKVKAYMGASGTGDDGVLTNLIAAVSEAIEHYCGREFALGERTEYHDGQGAPSLVLACRPVTEIEGIYVDPQRVFADASRMAESSYTFYPGEGIVRMDAGVFPGGVRNIKVVYSAGYAVTPPAVEQAANILVCHFFNRGRQGGDGVESESIGSYTVSYDTGEWPHQARGLLSEYREVSF